MIASGGEPGLAVPVYELAEPTTEQEYNTGVKLFDRAKSFTILCEATYINYSWSTWSQGLFGILNGNKNYMFKIGSIESGKDHQSGSQVSTGNRYTALVMNETTSHRYCTDIFSKTNGTRTHKFFVRYNASTRLVECGIEGLPTTHYYTVDGQISSEEELKLLIGGATGTISIFKVYLSLLSDDEINAFYE